MYYSFEHFEKDTAVLEDDEENRVLVPRALLPSEVKTGDVFTREGKAYRFAPQETERRREAVRRLQQKLRKRK
ncbi:MAG TPA: DUF3006 domain-containing protein [Firmicutes bacterium]|nr:DUF3006 domain-containing protein [Bacillota bacterium]